MNLPHLTICYQTCRKAPQIEWFLHSLHRECGGDYTGIKIVVVSVHELAECQTKDFTDRHTFSHPKPNVWQGAHRLTKEDYFAAANSRNTALCLCPDGWAAFVDDLSILMPGWLGCVHDAMFNNYIALGAYKKVRNLVVSNGKARSFVESPSGLDSRWDMGSDTPVVAPGGWLYGCSFAAPVEALLTVNGSDENADGLGFEDCLLGIRMENAGYRFRYDRRMLTLESEELHHVEKAFKRTDKGVSPNDKSHSILRQAQGSAWAPNYFGAEGIRGLRQRVLAGEPFPVCQIPDRDWYDGQRLAEF